MIDLREDLVLLKQVKDKTPAIVTVGNKEDSKKYYDTVVVQVGFAVTRFKTGDKVIIHTALTPIPLDPFDTGIKTAHAIVTESSIYGRIS